MMVPVLDVSGIYLKMGAKEKYSFYNYTFYLFIMGGKI
jgi:hypothetical protein